MTPESQMEVAVWAAAFAAEFAKDRAFYDEHGGGRRTIDDISGFSCAEVADVALQKYREAISGDDAEYLLPVKEQWGAI